MGGRCTCGAVGLAAPMTCAARISGVASNALKGHPLATSKLNRGRKWQRITGVSQFLQR